MKIPPELHEPILARVAKGQALQAVADWLKSAHAISVSKMALSKLVRKHRAERAQTSKHIVREHIEQKLPQDLEILDKIFATNVRLCRRAQIAASKDLTTANVEKVEKLTRLVLKADESKRKALGVDQPDESPFQGLAELVGMALK
jgi:hypothetical protein